MPNGTLCGKAVVEMLFGAQSGAHAEDVEERLVRSGNLPQAYVITEERIARARALESVQVQDGNDEKERWRAGRLV